MLKRKTTGHCLWQAKLSHLCGRWMYARWVSAPYPAPPAAPEMQHHSHGDMWPSRWFSESDGIQLKGKGTFNHGIDLWRGPRTDLGRALMVESVGGGGQRHALLHVMRSPQTNGQGLVMEKESSHTEIWMQVSCTKQHRLKSRYCN